MFQEFPKMLVREDEQCTVEDAEQEKAARADGWHSFGDDAEAKKKPGRPPKAKDAD